MPDPLHIDPKTAALLVMDFQTLIVEGFASDKDALLARTARLIEVARGARLRVMYVVVGFREGHPEIDLRNITFGPIRQGSMFTLGSAETGIHSAVAPQPGDVVVTKHRVGAFYGTDLDIILRANGIDTLLLAGIATSGVVLSTLRHAADADYRIVVVSDCCADKDAEVHRVLLQKIFARQASIVTCEEVLAAL
ncbi:MAG: cysteine hydrolase family protein [Rhizomicrobium sp.]